MATSLRRASWSVVGTTLKLRKTRASPELGLGVSQQKTPTNTNDTTAQQVGSTALGVGEVSSWRWRKLAAPLRRASWSVVGTTLKLRKDRASPELGLGVNRQKTPTNTNDTTAQQVGSTALGVGEVSSWRWRELAASLRRASWSVVGTTLKLRKDRVSPELGLGVSSPKTRTNTNDTTAQQVGSTTLGGGGVSSVGGSCQFCCEVW